MEIFDYMIRTAPGFFLFGLLMFLLPRKLHGVRILCHIMLFILIRDAMTPMKFWSFATEGVFWIRFTGDSFLLVILGLTSIFITLAIYFYEKDLRSLVVWSRGNIIHGIAAGIITAVIIAIPVALLHVSGPAAYRGGAVSALLYGPLLVVTLGGNLYEEFLFRGLFQGYLLREGSGETKAALLSGVTFAFGHTFLALTVTNAGWPLLAFALWEGVVCGFVRMKYGVIPAALSHGGAIFVLSSSIIV